MSLGYGRGYYGSSQLARPPRRRGGGWAKLALVVGVGAVVWLMWPKLEQQPWPGRDGDEPKPPPPPPPPLEGQPAQPAQPDQLAESRGYPSQRAYEDAVVASARQLQAAGAKVVLAPHLQHLASRLEP